MVILPSNGPGFVFVFCSRRCRIAKNGNQNPFQRSVAAWKNLATLLLPTAEQKSPREQLKSASKRSGGGGEGGHFAAYHPHTKRSLAPACAANPAPFDKNLIPASDRSDSAPPRPVNAIAIVVETARQINPPRMEGRRLYAGRRHYRPFREERLGWTDGSASEAPPHPPRDDRFLSEGGGNYISLAPSR